MVVQQFYWLITFCGSSRGQSYLATPVRRKIAQKCLEILILLYNLHIQLQAKKFFFCFFEQLFKRLRETF